MSVRVRLPVAKLRVGDIRLPSARTYDFHRQLVNRPQREVEIVDILLDKLVARSPCECKPSQQLVSDVFRHEVRGNFVPACEVCGLIPQANYRCDVSYLPVADAVYRLFYCGVVAHLCAAQHVQPLFVGEGNELIIYRFFGEDVLVGFKCFFYVARAEYRRSYERDYVGGGLQNLVYRIEP